MHYACQGRGHSGCSSRNLSRAQADRQAAGGPNPPGTRALTRLWRPRCRSTDATMVCVFFGNPEGALLLRAALIDRVLAPPAAAVAADDSSDGA
ncbi:hypothetical protein WDZ92_28000, partial [Nostoc sp. NIES-2111]